MEYTKEAFCKIIAKLQVERDANHKQYVDKDEQLKSQMLSAINNLTRISKKEK